MGRIKVYGGSWNLPDVSEMPNPFQCFITDGGVGPETLKESATPALPVSLRPERNLG